VTAVMALTFVIFYAILGIIDLSDLMEVTTDTYRQRLLEETLVSDDYIAKTTSYYGVLLRYLTLILLSNDHMNGFRSIKIADGFSILVRYWLKLLMNADQLFTLI
jgi:hypothetical protein